MNIIERIDNLDYGLISGKTEEVLTDCKLEIERLTLANETLKGLCEDYQTQIKQAKEYTPMTDDELNTIIKASFYECETAYMQAHYRPYGRKLETEVIKRAGLVVKEKE